LATLCSTIRKQQDSQSRHITRLEQTLKGAADKQGIWRSRIVAKQAELDSAKATNGELLQQISSLKTRSALESPGSNSKLTSLNSRANNAERKLAVAQTQQSHAEDRLEDAKRKYDESEGKWAARIKELEHRCRAAEEKHTRDKQSAKERLRELEEQLR
jgi:chromosome segregation ATPase